MSNENYLKYGDGIKNDDGLNDKDSLKNKDNLKNEDNLKKFRQPQEGGHPFFYGTFW